MAKTATMKKARKPSFWKKQAHATAVHNKKLEAIIAYFLYKHGGDDCAETMKVSSLESLNKGGQRITLTKAENDCVTVGIEESAPIKAEES